MSFPYRPVPVGERVNVLAMIAVGGAIMFPMAGVIVGVIALRQIKYSRERGRGCAWFAICLGTLFSVAMIAMTIWGELAFR